MLTQTVTVQSKMGSGKDFEMSPFEAARKLLSVEAQHLSLGAQSDLIFQDMDLVPLLIQENYLNHRPVVATNDQRRMQVLAGPSTRCQSERVQCHHAQRGSSHICIAAHTYVWLFVSIGSAVHTHVVQSYTHRQETIYMLMQFFHDMQCYIDAQLHTGRRASTY